MTHPSLPILHRILKPLCELPYDLVEHTSGTSSVITLTLQYSDVGKILGRENIVRESLKVIVEAIGQGCGIVTKLELDYPKHGERLERARPPHDPHFDPALATGLVGDILALVVGEDGYRLDIAAGNRYLILDIVPIVEIPEGLSPAPPKQISDALIKAIDVVAYAWGAALGRRGIIVRQIGVSA